MAPLSALYTSLPYSRQRGFTISELMVAAAIGIILLGAIATLVATSTEGYRELHRRNEQMENGRVALQILSEELQHAGFYGETDVLYAVPATFPSPCTTITTEIQGALALPITGFNDVVTSAALPNCTTPACDCIPVDELVNGTDVLTIRRASTQITDSNGNQLIDANELKDGAVYIQTSNEGAIVGRALNDPGSDSDTFYHTKKDGTTKADIRAMLVSTYYIANNNGVPTLKRQELSYDQNTGVTTMTEVPLVDGIEQVQIDYGMDSNGDGAPDAYLPANNLSNSSTPTTTLTDWTNVVTVRLNIISRSLQPTPEYSDDKIYSLGSHGNWTPSSTEKKFRRHAYTTTIRLENISGRRDS